MKQTFYSIQALRGLAASLVVIAHIFEHPSRGDPNALLLTGRFGVEIFFVISGFVMTHVAGEGAFSPGAFAVRRIMRIVPLYWVCTLLVFAVALVAPALFKTTTADVKHLVLSLFFIPAPDPQAASDWRPLFKLGWTLNYEMFFYAALLLLFWCRQRIQRSVILTVALGALVLLSFAIPPKAEHPRVLRQHRADPVPGRRVAGGGLRPVRARAALGDRCAGCGGGAQHGVALSTAVRTRCAISRRTW